MVMLERSWVSSPASARTTAISPTTLVWSSEPVRTRPSVKATAAPSSSHHSGVKARAFWMLKLIPRPGPAG